MAKRNGRAVRKAMTAASDAPPADSTLQESAKPKAVGKAARRRRVETMMAEGIPRAAIVRECWRKFGIKARTTDDLIREVRDRWGRFGAELDSEKRREELRQMATTGWNMARTAKRPITVGDGDGASHVEMVDQPNHAAMAKFVEIRGKLDGVFTENHKHEVSENLASVMAACVKRDK